MNQHRFACILLFGLLACSSKRGQEFRGHLIARHDGVAFKPCGSTETWWANFDSALVETTMVFVEKGPGGKPPVAPTPPPLPPPVFMTLRGDTSSVGAYGPEAAFQRQYWCTHLVTLLVPVHKGAA